MTAVEKSFTKLASQLHVRLFDKALSTCDRILKLTLNSVKVKKAKCYCLIQLNSFEAAIKIAQENKLHYEKAYCLYRLKRNDEALKALDNEDVDHVHREVLKAQIFYRLGSYDKAAKSYDFIISEGRKDAEIVTNWIAAHISSDRIIEESTMQKACEFVSQTPFSNFELEFNLASGYAKNGDFLKARKSISHCIEAAREILAEEEYVEEEVDSEIATLSVQQAYIEEKAKNLNLAEQIYIDSLEKKPSDEIARAVAANSLMVLRNSKDLFDSYKRVKSCTSESVLARMPLSLKGNILVNKAVLLLLMRKRDECRVILNLLRSMHTNTVIADLIEAALLIREKKTQKCISYLKEKSKKASADTSALEYDLTLAQVLMSTSRFEEAIELLNSIDEIKHTPKVVATLVELYERSQTSEGAVSCFEESIKYNLETKNWNRSLILLMAYGDFLFTHGKHEKAAAQYGRILSGELPSIEASVRFKSLAKYVISLSHFNPDLAEEKAVSLPLPENLDSFDAEELEKAGFSRVRTVKDRSSESTLKQEEIKQKKLETRRRKVAKAREKRRTEYLKRLKAEKGEDFHLEANLPDPERWIPKRFRKGAKQFKMKRGKKLTGGQGAGDVASRKAVTLDARQMAIKREEEKKIKELEKAAYNEANKKKSSTRRKKKGRR